MLQSKEAYAEGWREVGMGENSAITVVGRRVDQAQGDYGIGSGGAHQTLSLGLIYLY